MLVVKKDPGIRGAINRGQQEMAIIMRARLGGGTGATEVTSLVGSVDLSGRVSQEGFLASCLDWWGVRRWWGGEGTNQDFIANDRS